MNYIDIRITMIIFIIILFVFIAYIVIKPKQYIESYDDLSCTINDSMERCSYNKPNQNIMNSNDDLKNLGDLSDKLYCKDTVDGNETIKYDCIGATTDSPGFCVPQKCKTNINNYCMFDHHDSSWSRLGQYGREKYHTDKILQVLGNSHLYERICPAEKPFCINKTPYKQRQGMCSSNPINNESCLSYNDCNNKNLRPFLSTKNKKLYNKLDSQDQEKANACVYGYKKTDSENSTLEFKAGSCEKLNQFYFYGPDTKNIRKCKYNYDNNINISKKSMHRCDAANPYCIDNYNHRIKWGYCSDVKPDDNKPYSSKNNSCYGRFHKRYLHCSEADNNETNCRRATDINLKACYYNNKDGKCRASQKACNGHANEILMIKPIWANMHESNKTNIGKYRFSIAGDCPKHMDQAHATFDDRGNEKTLDQCKTYCINYGSKCKGFAYNEKGHCKLRIIPNKYKNDSIWAHEDSDVYFIRFKPKGGNPEDYQHLVYDNDNQTYDNGTGKEDEGKAISSFAKLNGWRDNGTLEEGWGCCYKEQWKKDTSDYSSAMEAATAICEDNEGCFYFTVDPNNEMVFYPTSEIGFRGITYDISLGNNDPIKYPKDKDKAAIYRYVKRSVKKYNKYIVKREINNKQIKHKKIPDKLIGKIKKVSLQWLKDNNRIYKSVNKWHDEFDNIFSQEYIIGATCAQDREKVNSDQDYVGNKESKEHHYRPIWSYPGTNATFFNDGLSKNWYNKYMGHITPNS